jgi:hypothetical protein
MADLTPEELISRHVQKMLERLDPRKVEELLRRCHLVRVGDVVHRPTGTLTENDSFEYKQAVKEIFGDAVYSFAKVNFVLGGCHCRLCGRL